jgi:hypothetical protein
VTSRHQRGARACHPSIVHPGLPGPGHAPASVFALRIRPDPLPGDCRRSGRITLAGLRLTREGFRSTPSSSISPERMFHGACAVTSFFRAAFRSPCVPAWLGQGVSAPAALMGFSLRRFGPVRGWRGVSIPPRPPAFGLARFRPVIFAGDRLAGSSSSPTCHTWRPRSRRDLASGFSPRGQVRGPHRPYADDRITVLPWALPLSGFRPPFGAPPDGTDSPAIARPPAPAFPLPGAIRRSSSVRSALVVGRPLTT